MDFLEKYVAPIGIGFFALVVTAFCVFAPAQNNASATPVYAAPALEEAPVAVSVPNAPAEEASANVSRSVSSYHDEPDAAVLAEDQDPMLVAQLAENAQFESELRNYEEPEQYDEKTFVDDASEFAE